MQNSVNQQVIDFTADYVGQPPESITDSTTYTSIGIESEDSLTQYIVELEQFFGLSYQDGDQDGIVVVANAVTMIKKKLG